jgi:hypothetical protein
MNTENEIRKLVEKEINDYNYIFKQHDEERLEDCKTLKCKICSKQFSNRSNLLKHVNRIHRHLGFQCEYEGCGKWYSDKHYLKIHISKNHMQERLFKCKYCDKGYTYKLTFMAHLREAHLHIYPYLCIVKNCLSAFSIKRKMINHIKSYHRGLVSDIIKLLNENNNIKS